MIHHQIMNFPFHDHLVYLSHPEPEPKSENTVFLPPSTTRVATGDPSPMEAMREMMFRIAAMQPVQVDPDSVRPRKRKNVRISRDPQSVAARHRRERISERIRVLQRLVPGGTKMDTASMLEEAVRYLKFLKREVVSLEEVSGFGPGPGFEKRAWAEKGSGFGSGLGIEKRAWAEKGSGFGPSACFEKRDWAEEGLGFGPDGPAGHCVGRAEKGLRGPCPVMYSNVVGEGV